MTSPKPTEWTLVYEQTPLLLELYAIAILQALILFVLSAFWGRLLAVTCTAGTLWVNKGQWLSQIHLQGLPVQLNNLPVCAGWIIYSTWSCRYWSQSRGCVVCAGRLPRPCWCLQQHQEFWSHKQTSRHSAASGTFMTCCSLCLCKEGWTFWVKALMSSTVGLAAVQNFKLWRTPC